RFAHEHASDDDQSASSKSSKASHNAWLPSKRNVNGARAKLGVVTSKPATSSKSKATTKVSKSTVEVTEVVVNSTQKATKSTLGAEAPPFVPTPMSESPSTDTTPQASVDTPPTVPATLPILARSSIIPGPSDANRLNGATDPASGVIPVKASSSPGDLPLAASAPTQQSPSTSSSHPLAPASQSSNPVPRDSPSRQTTPTPTPLTSALDKPVSALSDSNKKSLKVSKELSEGTKKATAEVTKDISTAPTSSRAGTPKTVSHHHLFNSIAAPDLTRPPAKATPPIGSGSATALITKFDSAKGARIDRTTYTSPRALMAALPGQKAPPTGPRALMNAFRTRSSSPATLSTSATAKATNGTSSHNSDATASRSTPAGGAPTPGASGTTLATIASTIPKASVKATRHRALLGWLDAQGEMSKQVQVKKEMDQEPLGMISPWGIRRLWPLRGARLLFRLHKGHLYKKPHQAKLLRNYPQFQSIVNRTMDESMSTVPMEGDSSFGVSAEDLFPNSTTLTEDASIIPQQDLPPLAPTQKPSIATTDETIPAPLPDSPPVPPARDPLHTSTTLSTTPRASTSARPRTPIRSPSRDPLSFFGISSSPGSLLAALPPSSSSPTKRKSDTLESRLIKRRRHRTSSSKSEPIIVEPEISALEAEKARAAELQAEEERVRELLGVDMSDYAESVMARLSGSDKSNRGVLSGSEKSKGSPGMQESISVESDLDLELRSLRAMRDENEALKLKIKVLEMTLPTAESVKNELYAERKEKTQLIEALEIERSLLTQSEALRKQSDATREGLQQRIKQLEERLAESSGNLEKAREVAQAAAEQRRKAEEAALLAETERTKLGTMLDAERDLVSQERAALAEERGIRAEAQAKLAAAEARLAAEQRRYTEARDQAEKERAEAKSFLDAEKAIASAQEAKLEREKEIRGELEAKLKEMEEKIKDEQAKQVEDRKKADAILQRELTMAMKLVTAEREITRAERVKTGAELEAKESAEKEVILLKEQLAAIEKKLSEVQDGNNSMKRDLTTFKDQLNESQGENTLSEHSYLRLTLAKERISRKELESKLVVTEERLAASAKQAAELQTQLKTAVSSGQGSNDQLQTQRTLLHIARTRIQELEQAIQRVESDLDASRTAEATAKTMVQLWGPPLSRTHLSSPVSDIVDRNTEQTEMEVNPFVSLMKPPRQQSFKLKRTAVPARLLKVDMPSGEVANIDLGGLPANPEAIIDLLYKSKCAGCSGILLWMSMVQWVVLMLPRQSRQASSSTNSDELF
ncbi:hypothetical protein RHS01_00491, partial [Rhizoctonia solani]